MNPTRSNLSSKSQITGLLSRVSGFRGLSGSEAPMSALGQKRTFYVAVRESALPPKADINVAVQYVRLVPIADIWGKQHLGNGATESGPVEAMISQCRRKRRSRMAVVVVRMAGAAAVSIRDSSAASTGGKRCADEVADEAAEHKPE